MTCVQLELAGKRFGKLVAIEKTDERYRKNVLWKCKCDCGNEVLVIASRLTSGHTKSCGCLIKENIKNVAKAYRESSSYKPPKSRRTHGGTGSRLYILWTSMKERCNNPNAKNYPNYGGRGTKICDEWNDNYSAFQEWAENNGYMEGLTIDRIDNSQGYNPQNCRWVTIEEQANNKTTNRYITIDGIKKTLAQWAKASGNDYNTIWRRIAKSGWDEKKAIFTPTNKPYKPYKKNGGI